MKKLIMFVIFSMFLISSCEKEEMLTIKPQVRISFVNSPMGSVMDFGDSIHSSSALSPQDYRVYFFDKTKFIGYDKIYFVGTAAIKRFYSWPTNYTLDLYNISNSEPILGSEFEFIYPENSSITEYSPYTELVRFKTKNFWNNLPPNEIEIAMRKIRNSNGMWCEIKKAELVIE